MQIKSVPIDFDRASILIDSKPAGMIAQDRSTIRAIHYGGPRKEADWLKLERKPFTNLSDAINWIIEREELLK